MHKYLLIFISIFCNLVASAKDLPQSDTLKVTLVMADSMFVKNSLQLINTYYNINSAQGALLQAKLWDNPQISYSQNFYNPNDHRILNSNGEFTSNIQQLIYLGGKRSNRIKLEKINVQSAEYDYYNTLRNLKYKLHSKFFEIYYQQKSIAIYDEEISTLKKLVEVFSVQYEKGNISLKETTRLKAMLFTLQNEYIDLINKIKDDQTELCNLLSIKHIYVVPEIDDTKYEKMKIDTLKYNYLSQIADSFRFDNKIVENAVKWGETNLKLQKSLIVPDIILGAGFDKYNSGYPNYNAMTVQMSLPFFNRNQGNIKMADVTYKQSQNEYQQFKIELENEVVAALYKAQTADELYQQLDKHMNNDFNLLIEGIRFGFVYKLHLPFLYFLDSG